MAPSLAEEGRELIDTLRKTDCNWVGVTAAAGAGHMRQLWNVEKTLEVAGKEMTWVELNIAKSSWWAATFLNTYNRLQNHPEVMKAALSIFESSIFNARVDAECRKLGQPDVLEDKIRSSTIYRESKPTIVVASHAVGAQSAALLSERKGWDKLVLGEFLPDPWEGLDLKLMAAMDTAGKGRHLVIVHDQDTADKYSRIRPGREVVPLGTLSPPDSMFEVQTEKKDYSRISPHVGIEFSGNEIPNYDTKILIFLETMEEKIKNGQVHVTIHTMHHKGTQEKIDNWAASAGLTESVFLHIIRANNMPDAIRSRYEYAVGRDEFGKPIAVFAKGGEVQLEDRGRTLIVAVYNGSPHEDRDILVAVREKPGFVVDMRKLPEKMWWEVIQQKLNEMPESFPEVRSRALLALGMLAKLTQP